MKTITRVFLLLACLQAGLFITRVYADQPPEPPSPPGGGHGSGNNQPPAGAPIDGGLGILVLLGTAFGCVKMTRREKENEAKGDFH